jgi:hypothetical protein
MQGVGAVGTPGLGVNLDLGHVTHVSGLAEDGGGSPLCHAMISRTPRIPALRWCTPRRSARSGCARSALSAKRAAPRGLRIAPALRESAVARERHDSRQHSRHWRRPDRGARPVKPWARAQESKRHPASRMPPPCRATRGLRVGAVITPMQCERSCPRFCTVSSRVAHRGAAVRLRRSASIWRLPSLGASGSGGAYAGTPNSTVSSRVIWRMRSTSQVR